MTPITRKKTTVLVIEDERMLRLTLGDHLRDRGIEVLEADNGETGLQLYREHQPDLITLDLRMAPMDGHTVLAAIRETDWDIPVIILTGHGQFDDVVKALRNGASDYLLKPLSDMAIFDLAMERALERWALRRDNARLSKAFLAEDLEHPEYFDDILTTTPRMRDIFRYCEAIARTGEPILITGETGVGKELLARALHRASQRPGEFIALNIAGLDEQAFSDTLYGHARGAFTGADKAREGFMAQARRGSLFLDEIGELPPNAQVRLLRVLQEREFHPLGSDMPRPFSAGIIAATNRPVDELRSDKRFRNDFFYRLTTHSVHLPALRERREDIPLLLNHFLDQAAETCGRKTPRLNTTVADAAENYAFPGNIRELRAMAFDALTRENGDILGLGAFPELGNAPGSARIQFEPESSRDIFVQTAPLPTIREATGALVDEALRRSGGIQKKAAALLGISPQSLSERLKRRNS